jgi:hypothetical protein
LHTVLNTLAQTLASFVLAFGRLARTPKPLKGVSAQGLWLLLVLVLARLNLISTFIFQE